MPFGLTTSQGGNRLNPDTVQKLPDFLLGSCVTVVMDQYPRPTCINGG